MATLGNPHLVDHLHPLARLETHLRGMPEGVDLRSHPRHCAVGHDHADAPALCRRGIPDPCGDGIDIACPQPAVAPGHGPHRDIAGGIDGPDLDRGSGREPLGGIEVVARAGPQVGLIGKNTHGRGQAARLFRGDDHADAAWQMEQARHDYDRDHDPNHDRKHPQPVCQARPVCQSKKEPLLNCNPRRAPRGAGIIRGCHPGECRGAHAKSHRGNGLKKQARRRGLGTSSTRCKGPHRSEPSRGLVDHPQPRLKSRFSNRLTPVQTASAGLPDTPLSGNFAGAGAVQEDCVASLRP